MFSNKDIKLPSKKKEIDCHGIIDYWTTSIKEGINWVVFSEYHAVYRG